MSDARATVSIGLDLAIAGKNSTTLDNILGGVDAMIPQYSRRSALEAGVERISL
jgi:hypothetical protein